MIGVEVGLLFFGVRFPEQGAVTPALPAEPYE